MISFLSFIAKPGAPGAPEVVNQTKDSATITWSPPSMDGGSPVHNYRIEQKSTHEFQWKLVTHDQILTNTYTIYGLKEGVDYEFRVAAQNKAGYGDWSNASRRSKFGKEIWIFGYRPFFLPFYG